MQAPWPALGESPRFCPWLPNAVGSAVVKSLPWLNLGLCTVWSAQILLGKSCCHYLSAVLGYIDSLACTSVRNTSAHESARCRSPHDWHNHAIALRLQAFNAQVVIFDFDAMQFALTIGTIVLGLYIASKAIDEKCALRPWCSPASAQACDF